VRREGNQSENGNQKTGSRRGLCGKGEEPKREVTGGDDSLKVLDGNVRSQGALPNPYEKKFKNRSEKEKIFGVGKKKKSL